LKRELFIPLLTLMKGKGSENRRFADATQPNCGELLKSSDTTSIGKPLEGTRVMTGSNGNNSEDGTIRSQAPNGE
jgi:hypothetical protein